MHDMNIHDKHDYAPSGFAIACRAAHSRPAMNIARIRKARGLNQTELAEMAGVSQATISRAEKGEDGATLGNLKAIAAALRVHLSDLFQDDRTAAEQAVIETYRSLPAERQKGWQDVLRLAASDPPGSGQETSQTKPR